MASNYGQRQTSGGHPPSTTTFQEKKLRWIENRMRKKREQTMKVGYKLPQSLQGANPYDNRTMTLHQA
jgi:hypothetical protein